LRLPRYPVLLVLLALPGAITLAGCGGESAPPLATPTQAVATTEPTSTSGPEPEPTNTTEESSDWVTYTPDDDKFKIEFPGEPEEQTMPAETSIGEITVHTASYIADGPEYNLSYNDLPAQMAGMDGETAAAVLQDSLDDLAQGGEFRNQKVVEVNGYLGIRGEIDMDMSYAWFMTVITPKRHYQIIMITSDQGKDTFAADAQRYIDSFLIMGD
jgi:hypothetical protein